MVVSHRSSTSRTLPRRGSKGVLAEFVPPDYVTARSRFREALAGRATVESHAVPGGPDLTIDVARLGPPDAERLVIILLSATDQQLQIHFGPKLKDDLGLEGPTVTKELLVPHFLPHAKQGKLAEGLVSLLRSTEKWITKREATNPDKPK